MPRKTRRIRERKAHADSPRPDLPLSHLCPKPVGVGGGAAWHRHVMSITTPKAMRADAIAREMVVARARG